MTRPPAEEPARTSRFLERQRRGAAAVLRAAALVLIVTAASTPAAGQWWTGREAPTEPDYPELTVTVEWLGRNAGARDVVVVDARDAASYAGGHISGALSLPPESFPDIGSLQGLARLPGALGELGLTGRERLVCCGESSYSPEASTLFWLMECAGADRVFLLEGGVSGWVASGRDLVREAAARPAAVWSRRPCAELIATREYVRRVYGEPGHEIVDARGADAWRGPVGESEGETETRAGHVPHSLPFDFTSFFAPDGTLLPQADTWRAFSRLGPRPANPVDLNDEFIVHGWGSIAAPEGAKRRDEECNVEWSDGAVGYFLLRRAGLARVRYYSGGWRDWAGDPYLPVVRLVGAEELMERLSRARRWFRPGDPPASFAFFDVRHPADHARGHIRGSVSLRSDYFADSVDVRLERYWPKIDRETVPVVTYCYGESCIRSRATSTAAAREGFVRIERFLGGLDEWRHAGGELVRGE